MGKVTLFKYLLFVVVVGNLVLAAVVILGGLSSKKAEPIKPAQTSTNALH